MFESVPHGGILINRILQREERDEAIFRTKKMKKIAISEARVADLEMIGNGAMSPLTGFMGREDYQSVVNDMRLKTGHIWSLPITLPVARKVANSIKVGEQVALLEMHSKSNDAGGQLLGVMKVDDKFEYDKTHEARQIYRTTEIAHPGVERLMQQGDVCLGGEIWLIDRPANTTFPDHRRDPTITRAIFKERGWRTVVGFQTRNPIHRAHEYIQKCAMEIVDGLLLHPLVGETKSDDISAEVRMQSYQRLLSDYYPKDRVLLSVFPAAMRYAGPREAVFHAICRKNYGCTHFIVGRDHAGVGNYYGTYDAQQIFLQFKLDELGITPLFFEHSFYCKKCDTVITSKTCPHDKSEHMFLSGTQVRELLSRGEAPPPQFTRPEVAEVLIKGVTTSN